MTGWKCSSFSESAPRLRSKPSYTLAKGSSSPSASSTAGGREQPPFIQSCKECVREPERSFTFQTEQISKGLLLYLGPSSIQEKPAQWGSWICGGSWIYGGHHAFPGNENTYLLFHWVVLWIAICTLISANSLMCQLFPNGLRSRREEIKWCWDVKMKWLKNWHKPGELITKVSSKISRRVESHILFLKKG